MKFIEIDNESEIKDLYTELLRVAKVSDDDARTLILGFKGPKQITAKREITMNDLVTICKAKKVTFSFRIEYEDYIVNADDIVKQNAPVDLSGGQRPDPAYEAMKEQESLIKDPMELPKIPPGPKFGE